MEIVIGIYRKRGDPDSSIKEWIDGDRQRNL